jgi:hypothetical protein
MGSNLSNWYFRIALVWILIGVTLGNVMGASQNFTMAPVHAHINLLGWVSMSLFAFFYRLWPAAAATKLAKVQFWTYVPAHIVQMVALAMLFNGNKAIEPLLGAASMVVGIAFLLFAINAWKFTASTATSAQAIGTATAD